MLIGIVQKNAIMMIDFALAAERTRDVPTREAIFEACLLRFRPIMMTTLSALLAAIPLALGRGDGAELRQPLGIAIGGGLILSQLLTLYTTPIVYLYLDRLSDRARALKRRTRAAPRRLRAARRGRAAMIGTPTAVLRIAAIVGVAAVVASCNVGPDYVRPAADVPAAYKEAKGGAAPAPRTRCRRPSGGSSSAIRISMRWNRRWRSTTRRSSRRRRGCGRRKR